MSFYAMLLLALPNPIIDEVKYEPNSGMIMLSNLTRRLEVIRKGRANLTKRKDGELIGFTYTNGKPVACIQWSYNGDVRSPESAFYLFEPKNYEGRSQKLFSTRERTPVLLPSLKADKAIFLVQEVVSDGAGPTYKVEINLKTRDVKKSKSPEFSGGVRIISSKGGFVRFVASNKQVNAREQIYDNPIMLMLGKNNDEWHAGQPNWNNKLTFKSFNKKSFGNGIYESIINYSFDGKSHAVKLKEGGSVQLSSDANWMLVNGENAHLVQMSTGNVIWKKPITKNVRYWLR